MIEQFLEKWPALGPYVPERLERFFFDGGRRDLLGLTTHRTAFRLEWGATVFSAAGYAQAASVPDGFFAIGIFVQRSENVFIMWQRGNRRFHFYDLFSMLDETTGGRVGFSARTREHLGRALHDWEHSPDERVFYSIGKRVSDETLFAVTRDGTRMDALRRAAHRNPRVIAMASLDEIEELTRAPE